MPSIALEMGTIHYEEVGPADGRPVVCLHGIFMGGDLWTATATMLAEQGLRVITPTWPLGAHRAALRPGSDASPRGIAGIVDAFLRALDLSDVVLLGNDSGGAVSQLVAAHHGERVGSLILTNCDTPGHFPPALVKPIVLAARRPRSWGALVAPLRSAAVRRSPAAFGLLSHVDIDHLAKRWVEPLLSDPAVREDARRFAAGVIAGDLDVALEALRAAPIPTLLVWGEDDRIFPPAHAEAFIARLPHARLERIPHARTFVMIDAPERLAELVSSHALEQSAAVA